MEGSTAVQESPELPCGEGGGDTDESGRERSEGAVGAAERPTEERDAGSTTDGKAVTETGRDSSPSSSTDDVEGSRGIEDKKGNADEVLEQTASEESNRNVEFDTAAVKQMDGKESTDTTPEDVRENEGDKYEESQSNEGDNDQNMETGTQEEGEMEDGAMGMEGEAEGPAGTQGEGDVAEGPAGTQGEGDVAEGPAGTQGEGDIAEGPAGTQGEGDIAEGPAGTQGEGDIAEGPAGTQGEVDVENDPLRTHVEKKEDDNPTTQVEGGVAGDNQVVQSGNVNEEESVGVTLEEEGTPDENVSVADQSRGRRQDDKSTAEENEEDTSPETRDDIVSEKGKVEEDTKGAQGGKENEERRGSPVGNVGSEECVDEVPGDTQDEGVAEEQSVENNSEVTDGEKNLEQIEARVCEHEQPTERVTESESVAEEGEPQTERDGLEDMEYSSEGEREAVEDPTHNAAAADQEEEQSINVSTTADEGEDVPLPVQEEMEGGEEAKVDGSEAGVVQPVSLQEVDQVVSVGLEQADDASDEINRKPQEERESEEVELVDDQRGTEATAVEGDDPSAVAEDMDSGTATEQELSSQTLSLSSPLPTELSLPPPPLSSTPPSTHTSPPPKLSPPPLSTHTSPPHTLSSPPAEANSPDKPATSAPPSTAIPLTDAAEKASKKAHSEQEIEANSSPPQQRQSDSESVSGVVSLQSASDAKSCDEQEETGVRTKERASEAEGSSGEGGVRNEEHLSESEESIETLPVTCLQERVSNQDEEMGPDGVGQSDGVEAEDMEVNTGSNVVVSVGEGTPASDQLPTEQSVTTPSAPGEDTEATPTAQPVADQIPPPIDEQGPPLLMSTQEPSIPEQQLYDQSEVMPETPPATDQLLPHTDKQGPPISVSDGSTKEHGVPDPAQQADDQSETVLEESWSSLSKSTDTSTPSYRPDSREKVILPSQKTASDSSSPSTAEHMLMPSDTASHTVATPISAVDPILQVQTTSGTMAHESTQTSPLIPVTTQATPKATPTALISSLHTCTSTTTKRTQTVSTHPVASPTPTQNTSTHTHTSRTAQTVAPQSLHKSHTTKTGTHTSSTASTTDTHKSTSSAGTTATTYPSAAQFSSGAYQPVIQVTPSGTIMTLVPTAQLASLQLSQAAERNKPTGSASSPLHTRDSSVVKSGSAEKKRAAVVRPEALRAIGTPYFTSIHRMSVPKPRTFESMQMVRCHMEPTNIPVTATQIEPTTSQPGTTKPSPTVSSQIKPTNDITQHGHPHPGGMLQSTPLPANKTAAPAARVPVVQGVEPAEDGEKREGVMEEGESDAAGGKREGVMEEGESDAAGGKTAERLTVQEAETLEAREYLIRVYQ